MNPVRKCFTAGGRSSFLAAALFLVSLTLLLARPQPAIGSWSETGHMITARHSHTATRLADGRILVAGGEDGSFLNYLASAELFDPVTGTWSATWSLHTARSKHTATRLADGRVLVVGGTGAVGAPDSAEIYDPATGRWSDTDSLAYGRFLHTATLLYDERVLVAGGAHGGYSTTSIELFDPETETWSRSAMDTARHDHTATRLANGRVLVVGGVDNSDPYHAEEYLDNADIFNPADGTWSAPDPINLGRARHTATLLNDGRVLVAGGWRPNTFYDANCYLFDPTRGTWGHTDPLPWGGFEYHTATRLTDNRVLVTGGWINNVGAQSGVYLYNPADRSWTVASSLENQRYWHTATLLYDGRVLVAGGAGPGHLASAEIFDPQNHISNGSFETASVDPGGGSISLPDGSTAIAHWTVGDRVDYREDWQAAEGRRCLDLNAVDAGSIQQDFFTPVRTRFLVTFALAGNPGGIQGIKTLRVFESVGGRSQDFTFDTTGKSRADMGWTTKTFLFTSNGIFPLSSLEFRSLTPGPYGPALDKVRVVRVFSVPMPMIQLLLE